MQCPKCGYEPTLKQQMESTGQCHRCEAFYSEEEAGSRMGNAQIKSRRASSSPSGSVVIVDVKMPFLSMVVFMVKWALAAIPAMIIIGVIATVLSGTLGGLIFGFTGGGSSKKPLVSEEVQLYKELPPLTAQINQRLTESRAEQDSKPLASNKASVAVKVTGKSSKPMDMMGDGKQIAIDTVYQNNTGRKIVRFDGVVSVFNLADQHLLDFDVVVDGSIPADTAEFRRGNLLDYNSSQDKFLRTDSSSLKTEILIKSIMFSSGEILRL